jgi:hypothetical protein
LLADGRVQRDTHGALGAKDFTIPLGASSGWEAAVFDHVQAVVRTICQRLRQASLEADPSPSVGGSTFSFDIWPGHPLEHTVKAQLSELRARVGELRRRVDEHNRDHGVPEHHQQVVTYVGQCLIEHETAVGSDEESHVEP